MYAAREKADGVAKLLIEAKADLDVLTVVRPVGGCICMHACMHAQRSISRSLPWHADLTHLHHHRDCRRDWVRRMERRR